MNRNVFFELTIPYGFMADFQFKLFLYYSFVFAKYNILEKYD